jgi:putative membrane protein
MAQAVQDSLAEIELCEMALQKTSNEDIKIFAQQMIDEHSQLGHEIELLCSQKNIPLPKDLSAEHKTKMNELSSLSEENFDRKFIEHNVKDHETHIKVFEHYANEESDSDIKTLAKKGVKMLSEHLKMAKHIEQQMS